MLLQLFLIDKKVIEIIISFLECSDPITKYYKNRGEATSLKDNVLLFINFQNLKPHLNKPLTIKERKRIAKQSMIHQNANDEN